MANKYEFEVTGDVQDTINKLNQISQLQDDISKKGDNMFKSGGYSSGPNFQNLVKDMRLVNTLSNTVKGDLGSLQQQASANNDAKGMENLKKQAEQLEKQLKSTKSIYDELMTTTNIGATRGSQQTSRQNFALGIDQSKSTKDNKSFLKTTATTARAQQEEIRSRQRNTNNLSSRQADRAQRASDSGHISYIDNQRFQRDSSSGMSDMSSQATWIKEQRTKAEKNIKDAQRSVATGNQDLSSRKIDENEYNTIVADAKIMESTSMAYIKSLASLEAATQRATATLKNSDESMSASAPKVDAQKGSAADIFKTRLTSTVSNMVNAFAGNTTSRYQAGKNVNQSTWDQALQIGNISNMSSAQVRNTASNVGVKNGFGMADSLNFMQIAQQANRGSNSKPTDKYMNSLMRNARTSGIGQDNYFDLMSTATSGGAANNGKQVNAIVDSAVGGAKNSNTEGLLQTQIKYLTQIAKQQNSTIGSSTKGLENVSTLQSTLAKDSDSKAWKGEAGGNNLNNFNSAITSAATGGNEFTTRAILNAHNGQPGWSGIAGYAKAERQAEKGLTDPDNANNIMKQVTAISGGNKDAEQTYLGQVYKMGPEAAQGLIKTYNSGDMTKKSLNKALKTNKNTGEKTTDSNGNTVYTSTDEKTAEADAKKEQNEAKLQQQTGKFVSAISSQVNRMPPLLSAALTAITAGSAGIIRAILVAKASSIVSGGGGGGINTKTGKGEKTSGGGWFGKGGGKNTTKVSAAEKFSVKADMAQSKPAKYAYTGLSEASSILGKGKNWIGKGVNTASKIPIVGKVGGSIAKGGGKLLSHGNALMTAAFAATDLYSTYETTKDSSYVDPNASKKKQAAAKKKNKKKAIMNTAKEGGKIAGGTAAAWAGGEAGATIGSALGPVGTVVGGVVGSAAGYATGSGLVGWGEKKVGQAWDSLTGKNKKNSNNKNKNTTKQQKAVDDEKRNLEKWKQLLATAKQQNGLFGKSSNSTKITKKDDAVKINKKSNSSSTDKSSDTKSNATGNVIKSPTLSYLAEHQEETVVPTGAGSGSNGRSKQLARYAAQKTGVLGEGSGGGSSISMPITVNINGNASKDDANAIATTIQNKLKTSVSNNSLNWSVK